MEGPFPIPHQHAVAHLFGPLAELRGSLGTPQTPGTVEIHVGRVHLASATTFAAAIELAQVKAATLAVTC